MPYPPNVSRRDLERVGIIEQPVRCVECDREITSESHEEWCELKDASVDELAELEADEHVRTEYDPVEHK